MTHKWIYNFSRGTAEGKADMRDLLGGKGANLAEMCNIGLPVPPGFTVTTEVCGYFYKNNGRYPQDLESQLSRALQGIESLSGFTFGDKRKPLLVSVRSGARASMPGMMDTVLNLGLNDATVLGLGQCADNMRFAYDSYRRFIQMYANVVLDVEHDLFEETLHIAKKNKGISQDTDLEPQDLQILVRDYKRITEQETGFPFPQDPHAQLWGAIAAVFNSWQSQRAVVYRRLHDIPENWGTAVNVQAMVFGNMGSDCATGVAFTRDPSSGDNVFFGEYLVNAQGEDVVAGIRTPGSLTEAARKKHKSPLPSLEKCMPSSYGELREVRELLEKHYKDMQDIEFTIQEGVLYMLQTRTGKRTVRSALKIACDMVSEGLIDEDQAIMRVSPQSLEQLLHPLLDPKADRTVMAKGLPASPGAVSGKVVFSADEAERLAAEGQKVLLVRVETSPEDIHGMHAAEGILTTRGGMTSHAAVVARGMGTPCVTGAGSLDVNYATGVMRTREHQVREGEWITIDGLSGEILLGQMPTVRPQLGGDFARLMGWADARRRLKIRTNAETPEDVKMALQFGAEGIGLCRTEHMFFGEQRINAMRKMILADDASERRRALETILPMQRQDFIDIFTLMDGLPVTIRLLDPPLHEFLPRSQQEFAAVSESANLTVERLQIRARQLQEANPMLGHRGCRLLNSYPEICEMQARAIFEAAIHVQKHNGKQPLCEIMVPFVGIDKELQYLKQVIEDTAVAMSAESGVTLVYQIGTMIELPRACLVAAEIAEAAEFFSFGTNDLTQTTYGFSRDDATGFLNDYRACGIIDADPFATLDCDGVGELIKFAVERGRRTRVDLKLGICGEHGGDPKSIHFCERVGLDYVSCSPFRVPIARLTAAQAALQK